MASVSKREWTHKGVKKAAWCVRYVDHKGVRRRRTFDQKKAADKYAFEIEAQIRSGEGLLEADTKTIQQVCDEFLKASEQRLADGRIGRGRYEQLKHTVDRSILPHLGRRKIKDLRPVDIEEWYGVLCKSGGLAPRTAKDRVSTFAIIVDFGQKRGYLRGNVVREALKELRGIVAPKIKTFTVQDIHRLFIEVERKPRGAHAHTQPFTRAVVHLAAFCGLRWGEINALTLSHVDFNRRLLRIRHSITQWGELKSPKTRAGNRDVPMPNHVAAILRDWITMHYVQNEQELLFRTPRGGIIHSRNFHSKCWRPLLHRAVLVGEDGDYPHFHALRHFAASLMIENGWALTEVASMLGHSKFDVTLQVYAHPIVGGQRRHEMMDRMAAAFLGTPTALLPGSGVTIDAESTGDPPVTHETLSD